MPDQRETVVSAWARDADGDVQQFTGDDIYNRVARWSMDRVRRNIPTVATYYCELEHYRFANTIAVVPLAAVPLGVRIRRPDEVVEQGNFVAVAYKPPKTPSIEKV